MLDCVPLDTVTGAQVGMSPAKAVPDRAHVNASVIKNRFMDSSPFLRSGRCKVFYIEMSGTTMQGVLHSTLPQTNIPFAIARFLTPTRKALCPMKTPSAKLDASHVPANERALLLCERALELKDRGDYDGAREAMRPLWKEFGGRPDTEGLDPGVTAELLLCVGVLTSWVGSQNEIKEADDWAKDLINESGRLYEAAGDFKKVAEARTELAYCYWRAGALDEARVMFSEALQRLTTEGNTRANALLGLSVVEWSSSRYDEAQKILTNNALLFRKITSHTLKGFYHNQFAMVLRKLVTPENKTALLKRVINEYEEADRQFKLARNTVFRAHVKNNLGNVLRDLSRFRKAHEYLDHARRLTVSVRDRVRTAQVDESRAQVFIAERRYEPAEVAARNAASSFKKAGRQCFFAEALITQGIALARLGKSIRAEFTFRKAIEVAQQAGALSCAGIAALTLIEEIDDLTPQLLSGAYEQAGEWLSASQSQDILQRFKVAGTKLALKLRGEGEIATEVLFNRPRNFKQDLLEVERKMIRKALTEVNGSVTHAAALLGMSRQGLAYLIESRHPELLKERTPVRRRSRKPV